MRRKTQHPPLDMVEASFDYQGWIPEVGRCKKRVDLGRWRHKTNWIVCTPAKPKLATVPESIADLHMHMPPAHPVVFPASIHHENAISSQTRHHHTSNDGLHSPYPRDVTNERSVDLPEGRSSSKRVSYALGSAWMSSIVNTEILGLMKSSVVATAFRRKTVARRMAAAY